MIKNLFNYLKNNNVNTFKPVIDVNREYLYLIDNKGNKIFYNDDTDDFKIKW